MINIKPNTLLLGIFTTKSYKHYSVFDEVFTFSDIPTLPINNKITNEARILVSSIFDDTVNIWILEEVAYGCIIADEIIVLLEGIYFPIDITKSVTCSEIQLICKVPSFLNKTKFIKNKEIVNLDLSIVIKN